MEYPVQIAGERNWRSAALVAATVAAVELLVLVVLGVVWFAWPYAHSEKARAAANATAAAPAHAKTAGKSSTPSPAAEALLPRAQVSVVVLNGNGISGAADEASGRVRALRYIVTGATNAPRSDFARTLVMYRPGFEGEARRFAKDVGARRVAPLDGLRASDLMGAKIALILGRR